MPLLSRGISRAAIRRNRASSGVMDINLIKIRISGNQGPGRSRFWSLELLVVQSFTRFLVPDRQLKCLVLLFRKFNCQVNYYTLRHIIMICIIPFFCQSFLLFRRAYNFFSRGESSVIRILYLREYGAQRGRCTWMKTKTASSATTPR